MLRPSNSSTDQLVVLGTLGAASGIRDIKARTVFYDTLTANSDMTLKVSDGASLGLSFLNRLSPFRGRWTAEHRTSPDGNERLVDEQHFWVSAQDVESALVDEGYAIPDDLALTGVEEGKMTLDYMEFVPILIESVKELTARLEALETV